MDIFQYADERLTFLTMLFLLVPAALYIMGVMEGRKGLHTFLAGFFIHVAGIIHRGIEIGRLPLTEKHDNISFMALAMAAAYLYLYRKKAVRGIELTVIPVLVAFLFVAVKHRTINTMSPFMDSPWFYLHVFLYFLAYAVLGVAACIGVHYVLGGQKDYEQLQYRWTLTGWAVLSASLLAGGVWFYIAYGTYWLWTSKELWITLTWFLIGLYMHARMMGWLSGRPAAVLGCLGFAAALFTYFGVGTVIPAPPTQF